MHQVNPEPKETLIQSQKYGGAIWVFAGCATSTYFLRKCQPALIASTTTALRINEPQNNISKAVATFHAKQV